MTFQFSWGGKSEPVLVVKSHNYSHIITQPVLCVAKCLVLSTNAMDVWSISAMVIDKESQRDYCRLES